MTVRHVIATATTALALLVSIPLGPIDPDCYDRCFKNCRDDGGSLKDCKDSCSDLCRQPEK